jgi:hypothetical protein
MGCGRSPTSRKSRDVGQPIRGGHEFSRALSAKIRWALAPEGFVALFTKHEAAQLVPQLLDLLRVAGGAETFRQRFVVGFDSRSMSSTSMRLSLRSRCRAKTSTCRAILAGKVTLRRTCFARADFACARFAVATVTPVCTTMVHFAPRKARPPVRRKP